jgi:hypothetical protein
MAEYFRRAPELINFQDDLRIVLFELDVDVLRDCLDVRESLSQETVGISADRLTSSDSDENVRYSECRQLAREVVAEQLVGILCPSAAAKWPGAWNLVLFGDGESRGWECLADREVSPPRLVVEDVWPLAFT